MLRKRLDNERGGSCICGDTEIFTQLTIIIFINEKDAWRAESDLNTSLVDVMFLGFFILFYQDDLCGADTGFSGIKPLDVKGDVGWL